MKLVMKRIVGAIVFWAIVLGLCTGIGVYLESTEYENNIWSYFYKEEEDSINVLVMGSSAIYRYWIPPQVYEEQGYSSFLLTHAAQNMEAVPYLMEEAAKTQKPDLVVVEVRRCVMERAKICAGTLEKDRNTHFFKRMVLGMKPSINRVRMINNVLVEDDKNNKFEWNLPILKYHDVILKEPSEEEALDEDGEKEEVIADVADLGYQPLKGTKQKSVVTPVQLIEGYDENAYVLEECDKKLIDDIVKKAEKLGQRVLFVATPYIPDEYLYPIQCQLDDYIQEKGYDYLNLKDAYEELGLDFATDFYNERHTNINGAKKVTSYIAEYIAENYSISDKMSDSCRQGWENALADWKDKENKLLNEWEENCRILQEGNE